MIQQEIIQKALSNCLKETDLPDLGPVQRGKVRDSYTVDEKRVLVATDRQSAFDIILAEIPFKGQVLNQISQYWFEATQDIIQNHLIDVPDPNVSIVTICDVLPVEIVVRAYITGVTGTSAWHNYEKGERVFCGVQLPDGLKKNQKFDHTIITPTTKSDEHDEKISAEEIVKRGLVPKDTWEKIEKIALELFARGTEVAAERGLILVDTKYEMGLDSNGELMIIDEIHTPDSSRYWVADSYQERFDQGLEPEYLDKEFLRIWLREHGFEYGKEVPKIPDEVRVQFAQKYVDLFEKITGQVFNVPDLDQSINNRIAENLKKYFITGGRV